MRLSKVGGKGRSSGVATLGQGGLPGAPVFRGGRHKSKIVVNLYHFLKPNMTKVGEKENLLSWCHLLLLRRWEGNVDRSGLEARSRLQDRMVVEARPNSCLVYAGMMHIKSVVGQMSSR
ncbi:hypothetical protein AVEN_167713-1 [Araneus ventricosus]|uniref:Uncharacterized protein n=1 Tax=Araneus ventricosus TaxID=182803 RepID=A0A4Y2QK72_ARAVE|nr:hypothetical protein AVEN_167713-1 [Araneus ventricosus]